MSQYRKKVPIKDWPEEERPRERLHRYGPESLSDAQLLAILLRTGHTRKSALDVAMDLLNRYRNLRELSQTVISGICVVPGIGRAKAAQIAAAMELGKRIQAFPLKEGDIIRGSRDIYEACHPAMRDLKKEVFRVVLLNGKNRVIRTETVSQGSLTTCLVHPREVFAPAVRESSASVLLIHNHPSGDPTPSREDIEMNQRLIQAGELIGIRVLDHLVIGDGRYISFVDQGLMESAHPL
jgi:DNA repair protein RadC